MDFDSEVLGSKVTVTSSSAEAKEDDEGPLLKLSSFSADSDDRSEHKSRGQLVLGKLKSLMMLRRLTDYESRESVFTLL